MIPWNELKGITVLTILCFYFGVQLTAKSGGQLLLKVWRED